MLVKFSRLGRLFSTINAKAECLFDKDFPALAPKVSSLNKSLYSYLQRVNVEDTKLNAELLQLSSAEASSQNSDHLQTLRKQIAENSQKVKLYDDFRKSFEQFLECQEMLDSEDSELK